MGCQQSTASISSPAVASKNQVAEQALETPKFLVPAGPAPLASDNLSSKLALGAGCFWGTQKYIVKGELFMVVVLQRARYERTRQREFLSINFFFLRYNLHNLYHCVQTFKRNFQTLSKVPRSVS